MSSPHSPDVAVIGSGVFGAWTAYILQKSGSTVALLDAYGPANSRASSGGESRIIRMGYGPDDIYTRWSLRALPLWKQIFTEAHRPELFQKTGVLWIAHDQYQYAKDTLTALQNHKIPHERLSLLGLRKHYPQIAFDEDAWGIFEPESGVLLARRAVQTVVEQATKIGVEYKNAAVVAPENTATRKITNLKTAAGETISAGTYIFACGPWLGKIFPDVLANRIFPSRQEIFFFGVPSGETNFAQPALPTWLYLKDEFYGMPDLESRGFKVADDRHGPRVDPDTQSRVDSPEDLAAAQKFVARRFPALKNAPIVETRVCQYENTSNGDFLIDRHPDFDNVWLVGGGSGHGFKHGPSLGEYTAVRVTEASPAKNEIEPRFSLATKETHQN
ncbi:MAG: FAD-dependent oxidoreductase, partial [Candidatus Acidiferrales bacterium]